MMKAAIMGYGTIGSGVYEILKKDHGLIEKKAGQPIEVSRILDVREFEGTEVQDIIVHDIKEITEDDGIGIVVETMGGIHPAYEFVKECLTAGKHVVTSNKALVAECGTELLATAEENGVCFLFEASSGGGIPIIRTLEESLAGEEITEIRGILNGTDNYILTKMSSEGKDFDKALKEAQDLGYAERDPKADIEGWDTCRKIAILTSVATGREVDYKDVPTEGIQDITTIDFIYAKEIGASIKLFGTSIINDDRVYVEVAPVLIDATDPLYSVNDVYNGIIVTGKNLGVTMYYGSGAGKLPTASAVVGDMISAVSGRRKGMPVTWTAEKIETHPAGELARPYFARFAGEPGLKNDVIAKTFGECVCLTVEGADEFALITPALTEAEFDAAAEEIGGLRQKIVSGL